jgi:hypothetical protein
MNVISDDETGPEVFIESIWWIILHHVFGPCSNLDYNSFWDSAVFFDSRTPTFTFAFNVYAMLRQTTKGMYHTVNQLWLNQRGISTYHKLMLVRHQLESDVKSLHPIIAAYFRQAASGQQFGMTEVKEFMGNIYNILEYFDSPEEASHFVARLNNDLLYRALTQLFYDCFTSGDNASLEFSNQVGQLVIYGFSRDEAGDYLMGGLTNPDASVRLIFGVLKRLLGTDCILPALTWTQILPQLFEYLPHVEHWKDMQGFRMFCYVMRRRTDLPSWELFSRCFYYAVSHMEAPAVSIVDSNEFGKVLTWMLSRINTAVVQENTAVLLSIARLIAAWRLQHPDLKAPATLDLSMVVGSACSNKPMGLDVFGQSPLPLNLAADEFLQSPRGNLYAMSHDLEGRHDLKTIEDGFYHVLESGECLNTPYMHIQVFNSFVLWLLSRFPASQLRQYTEAICNRMRLLGCDGDGDDTLYVIDLKRKLSENPNLKRKFSIM